jgi:glucose-1-phosphate cytidylyltransferase
MRELTESIPKPLAEVCGKPMLWHIMMSYKHYGFDDFVLLLGYKGEKIKEYFIDYKWKHNDFTLETESNSIMFFESQKMNLKITFLDTGEETNTGGRIKQSQVITGNQPFMLTYGDGISDVDIDELLKFHKAKGKIATVTGVNKRSQYGTLEVVDGLATSFEEKQRHQGIINGGFFVLEPEIFDYLPDDKSCVFERNPLNQLVRNNELAVYMHNGFWTAADTYDDIMNLNNACDIWGNLW